VTRIDYRFTGCFFASMPDSFVSSPEKTQIEAIRLFRVYTGLKIPAISEKCRILPTIFESFQAIQACARLSSDAWIAEAFFHLVSRLIFRSRRWGATDPTGPWQVVLEERSCQKLGQQPEEWHDLWVMVR
jgi:hypothetical protein